MTSGIVAIDGALDEEAAGARQAEHGFDHQRAGDHERHGGTRGS